MTVSAGKRLERYVRERWGRSEGGIRKLASELHVSPDRIYEWFKEEAAPNTDQLADLARLLKVTRVEILAAMDGASADPSEALTRRVAREELEAMLTREIAAGRLQVLPGGRGGSRRGAEPQ